MTRLDSSLKITEFSGFLRSSLIDFVYEPFLIFSLLLFPVRSSSFKIFVHREHSFHSEVDFKLWLFFTSLTRPVHTVS